MEFEALPWVYIHTKSARSVVTSATTSFIRWGHRAQSYVTKLHEVRRVALQVNSRTTDLDLEEHNLELRSWYILCL